MEGRNFKKIAEPKSSLFLVPRRSTLSRHKHSPKWTIEEQARKKETPAIIDQAIESFFIITYHHLSSHLASTEPGRVLFKQLYLEANTDLFEYDAEYQEAILEKFVLNWKDRLQAWSIKYDYNILTFFAHRVANRSHTNEALYLLYLLYNRGVKPPRMIEILSMQNEQGWNVCLRLASRVDQKHNINYLLKLLIELTKYNPKDIWRLLSQESQTFVPYAKNMITTLPYLMMMSTDVDNKLLYIHLLKELERFSCTKEEIQQLNMNDNFVSVLQKAEVEVLFQLLFNNYLSKSVCEALVSRKREIFNYIYSIPEDEKNAALASALDDKNHALFFLLHKARYFTSTKETKGEWKRAKAEYEKTRR